MPIFNAEKQLQLENDKSVKCFIKSYASHLFVNLHTILFIVVFNDFCILERIRALIF